MRMGPWGPMRGNSCFPAVLFRTGATRRSWQRGGAPGFDNGVQGPELFSRGLFDQQWGGPRSGFVVVVPLFGFGPAGGTISVPMALSMMVESLTVGPWTEEESGSAVEPSSGCVKPTAPANHLTNVVTPPFCKGVSPGE